MQVPLQLGGVSLLALPNFDSTHNFIAEEAEGQATLRLRPHGKMLVHVANGEHLSCLGMYRDASFQLSQAEFKADIDSSAPVLLARGRADL
ncbi:hypothetical protein GUJ93_ZPchr0006g45221 [Zizania palustris]|uniref:Uncharacterized protein n=1 Tax=Zizania palustris TaxID=103762 RepID=A0A8J5S609_ZIZPA|nr:hypothetical protein GUJ93_ZPchr0006g45221 [Zizania palustris]